MIDMLNLTYVHQLASLADKLQTEWAWPAPDSGFAAHCFFAAGEKPPADRLTKIEGVVDANRIFQSPILSSIGYIRSIDQSSHSKLTKQWSAAISRLLKRNAFPPDRESFAYRPTELLGLSLGFRYIESTDKDLAQFKQILSETEERLRDSSLSQKLLSAYAAHILGVDWLPIVISHPEKLSDSELGIIFWLQSVDKELQAIKYSFEYSIGPTLLERSAIQWLSGSNYFEYAVLYFSLRRLSMNVLRETNAMLANENMMHSMNDDSSQNGLRVFISYSHDSTEHRDAVLKLANKLNEEEGILTDIDRYHELPPPKQGWPRWMQDQLDSVTYVLIVCTERYYQSFRGGIKGYGKGVTWEGAIITQELYDSSSHNTKFIPVGFGAYDKILPYIPETLRSTNYYDLTSQLQFERLIRHLTGQPETTRPKLGSRRVFPSA